MIDLRDNTLTIHQETRTTTIKMHEDATEAIISNKCNLRTLETSGELTIERVQAKMDSLGAMPQTTKNRYKDLLWK